jgi:outer membrane protein TolC
VRARTGFALALILILLSSPASAETGGTVVSAAAPLTAAEVLASSSRHFPGILKILAEQRVAVGKVLEADGAFDTVFSSEGFNRLNGFYDGRVAGAKVDQRFREFGGSIYGGYSNSGGDFPIYEDQYYTSTDGTVKVGVLFSLLRDRGIDRERFGVMDARLAVQEAELDVLLTRVGVQQRALNAYWRWVAAGRQLSVYEELLQLAIDRESGLRQQVEDGSRAEIFLTENAQNITRRKSLVLSARRDFRMAALELSYYYRDASGATLVPSPERLPAVGEMVADAGTVREAAESLNATLDRRPELKIIDTALERARNRIQLSENEMKPQLDLNFEYAYGLGDQGNGGPSKDSEDAIVGVTISVPLERRYARGRLAQARAKRDALEFERQRLEDQIELELRNILLDLNVAQELAKLAKQEMEQAEVMRLAERQRFRQGASDFFLVNLREEAAANARIRHFAALREARVALANYDAATVNLEQLGIDAAAP